MRVNIYYGGRGLIEDSTIYVIDKLTEVLEELRVKVKRYNLYQDRNAITTLPKTLKEADGVILAASVEWYGVGGFMNMFLDACWLYSDKQHISKLYMLPVVMASTYGERDAELTLIKSWELLGGIPCDGLCAYVEDHVKFETNTEYGKIIEKKAEQFYRAINQKINQLPSSNQAVKKSISKTASLELTPQESEQLSMYVSNETYVKKQKEDIKELTDIFRGLLGDNDVKIDYAEKLKKRFVGISDEEFTIQVNFSDEAEPYVIEVKKKEINGYKGKIDNADVILSTDIKIFAEIIEGKCGVQKAFMKGELSAKGRMELLMKFDALLK